LPLAYSYLQCVIGQCGVSTDRIII